MNSPVSNRNNPKNDITYLDDYDKYFKRLGINEDTNAVIYLLKGFKADKKVSYFVVVLDVENVEDVKIINWQKYDAGLSYALIRGICLDYDIELSSTNFLDIKRQSTTYKIDINVDNPDDVTVYLGADHKLEIREDTSYLDRIIDEIIEMADTVDYDIVENKTAVLKREVDSFISKMGLTISNRELYVQMKREKKIICNNGNDRHEYLHKKDDKNISYIVFNRSRCGTI